MDFDALGYSSDQIATLTTLASTAPEAAPAEIPESGGMPLMPGWAVTTLVGMAALATSFVLRRRQR
jgi:hypothetical protein